MEQGWILLYRKIKEKGYWKKSQYVHLWLHILLSVNHESKEFLWNGEAVNVKEGQFITGRKELSKETGIPETTIERILKVLESGHQIGQQKTSKYRLITVLKWRHYQKRTPLRTTSGQQADTNKELKELKEHSTSSREEDAHKNKTMKNTWKYNEKNSSDAFEDSIDIETGEPVKPKEPKRQKAINYIKEYFSSKCEKETKIKPMLTTRENIIIANLFKKGMKPSEITAVIDWWFDTQQDKTKLVHIGFCLNAVSITNFRLSKNL